MESRKSVLEKCKKVNLDLQNGLPLNLEVRINFAITAINDLINYIEDQSVQEDIQEKFPNQPKKEITAMQAYFKLEAWLYEHKEKPVEMKSAMAWGGLMVAHHAKEIDWNTMRNLYGEFMSKQMGLR